jgi:hypothetical protein
MGLQTGQIILNGFRYKASPAFLPDLQKSQDRGVTPLTRSTAQNPAF